MVKPPPTTFSRRKLSGAALPFLLQGRDAATRLILQGVRQFHTPRLMRRQPIRLSTLG